AREATERARGVLETVAIEAEPTAGDGVVFAHGLPRDAEELVRLASGGALPRRGGRARRRRESAAEKAQAFAASVRVRETGERRRVSRGEPSSICGVRRGASAREDR